MEFDVLCNGIYWGNSEGVYDEIRVDDQYSDVS